MNSEDILKRLDQFEITNSFRKRKGQFYLRKWYKLEQNIDTLTQSELRNAKILFTALSRLPDNERAFLAQKHNRPSIKKDGVVRKASDKLVAEEMNMDYQRFVKEKLRLEEKVSILTTQVAIILEEEEGVY